MHSSNCCCSSRLNMTSFLWTTLFQIHIQGSFRRPPSNLNMAIENILNFHIVPSVEWKSTVTTSFSHATHADPSTCIILIILGPSLPYLYIWVFPGGDAAPQTWIRVWGPWSPYKVCDDDDESSGPLQCLAMDIITCLMFIAIALLKQYLNGYIVYSLRHDSTYPLIFISFFEEEDTPQTEEYAI